MNGQLPVVACLASARSGSGSGLGTLAHLVTINQQIEWHVGTESGCARLSSESFSHRRLLLVARNPTSRSQATTGRERKRESALGYNKARNMTTISPTTVTVVYLEATFLSSSLLAAC